MTFKMLSRPSMNKLTLRSNAEEEVEEDQDSVKVEDAVTTIAEMIERVGTVKAEIAIEVSNSKLVLSPVRSKLTRTFCFRRRSI